MQLRGLHVSRDQSFLFITLVLIFFFFFQETPPTHHNRWCQTRPPAPTLVALASIISLITIILIISTITTTTIHHKVSRVLRLLILSHHINFRQQVSCLSLISKPTNKTITTMISMPGRPTTTCTQMKHTTLITSQTTVAEKTLSN